MLSLCIDGDSVLYDESLFEGIRVSLYHSLHRNVMAPHSSLIMMLIQQEHNCPLSELRSKASVLSSDIPLIIRRVCVADSLRVS